MSITSTTTTQTTHRATLAGGISVTLNAGTFGATLTLAEPGRALTLALTPAQVAEIAADTAKPFTSPAYRLWTSCHWFLGTARAWAGCADELRGLCDDDLATLRALARAYQETQP